MGTFPTWGAGAARSSAGLDLKRVRSHGRAEPPLGGATPWERAALIADQPPLCQVKKKGNGNKPGASPVAVTGSRA